MRYKVLGDSAGMNHGFEAGTIVSLYQNDGSDCKLYISDNGYSYFVADEDLEEF